MSERATGSPVAAKTPGAGASTLRRRIIHLRGTRTHEAPRITSPLCCQVVGEAVCSCACECGPVLAGVKVGPARARGADPGGAPPGPRLRAGWFGACQEQAEV